MIQSNTELNELAKRYVWWEPVEWSYRHPDIFLAQVMNLGSWKDIQMLCRLIKMNDLKKVLNQDFYQAHKLQSYNDDLCQEAHIRQNLHLPLYLNANLQE